MLARTLAAATLVAALYAGGAQANITFTLGNHPQPDEANILVETAETGTSLDHGEVDHTGSAVTFDSLTGQTLTQQAQGQADIFCASNCTNNGGNQSSQLNSIEMTAGLSANNLPTAWRDAILNLDFGTGTALISVIDNFGAPFSYVLGPGQNFLTMEASGGEFITDIKVTNDILADPFGFNSFKQPRVSGLCELGVTGCQPVTVPAPAIGHGLFAAMCIGTVLLSQRVRLFRRRDDDSAAA